MYFTFYSYVLLVINTRYSIIITYFILLLRILSYYYVLLLNTLILDPENFRCCRPDGSELYFISSNILHMFDQIMSMLPFATRTDMIEALKMSDARLSDVDAFLATLLAEHDAPGVRAQLKTLWIANVRSVLGEEENAAPGASEAGAGGEGAAARRQKAVTPHDSPHEDGAGCGD